MSKLFVLFLDIDESLLRAFCEKDIDNVSWKTVVDLNWKEIRDINVLCGMSHATQVAVNQIASVKVWRCFAVGIFCKAYVLHV